MAKLTRLTPEQEDEILDCVISGHTLEGLACSNGFTGKPQLMRYLAKYPDFQARFQNALSAQCIDLEEQLLHVADTYEKDLARTKLESISRILKFRDRKRYGDKTEVELNVTLDISGALDRAERRVEQIAETNVLLINPKKNADS